MSRDNQITTDVDKSFTIFLWLLSIESFYFGYGELSLVRQIPFGKGIMGLVMLTSEILLAVLAVRAYKENYQNLNPNVRFIILLTIIYNLGHIVYAVVWARDVSYISLFGNPLYQPAFMLPVAFLIGLNSNRFFLLHKCIWYYVLLMIPIYVVFQYVEVLAGAGILFLLAFARYLSRGKNVILLIIFFLYIVICYYGDARVPMIRVMMGGAILLFSYTSLYKSNLVKGVILSLGVTLPLIFLGLFATTGYSVFEQSQLSSYVSDLGVGHTGDTRTFLYEEIFQDLTDNDAWVFGKGINGTYYSSYFDNKYSLEKENRFLAEVGFLDFLLKGGIFQTILYWLLMIAAIFVSFFRSSNKFAVLLGLVIMSHYVLLFVEDVPRYDLYNIAMWFYIGLAFSLSDKEIDDEWCEEQFYLLFAKR